MKIAIVGDTHIGARGGNQHVRKFISKWFGYALEDMKSRGVETYVQVGDAVDIRSSLNAHDYAFIVDELIPLHKKHDINGVYIDGNHDLAYKESSSISWVSMIERLSLGMITRVDSPCDFDFGGFTAAMLPWINQENLEDSLKLLESSSSDICFGHLELGGFDMYRGSTCEESRFNLNVGHFKNFERVLSGHFHLMSEEGNIKYVGTPYPLTWQDYLDAEEGKRGYHIYDTVTKELEFIPNPEEFKTFFKVLSYDWKELSVDNTLQLQYKSVEELSTTIGLEGKVVKIMVLDRGNQKHYESFMSAVRQCKTIDVTVIDNTENFVGGDLGSSDAILNSAQEELSAQTDVITVLKERVDRGSLDGDYHTEAKKLIDDVYATSNNKGSL